MKLEYIVRSPEGAEDWDYGEECVRFIDGVEDEVLAYDGEPEDRFLFRNYRGLVKELNRLAELLSE